MEVYIPLESGWGEQAQVDWGQAQVSISGERKTAHLFCLRMKASGVPFVWSAPTEKLEAFLEGHKRAFEWLGGVPRECVYDNPKTAVVRILKGPEREEHTIFSGLRAHYLFDSQFCRPAQGHEKGAVENLVGYARRNTLVPIVDFPSWEALNEHLLAWCERERKRVEQKWEKEEQQLRALPLQPYQCSITRLVEVNKLSLVVFDRNRYSVPCQYVGRRLRLEATTWKIEVWNGAQKVAIHQRCYGRGENRLELEHYLKALERKPRAASNAAFLNQLPDIYQAAREALCRSRVDGYREFAAILLLHREFAAEQVAQALQEATSRGCLQASFVRQILLNENEAIKREPISVPDYLAQMAVVLPELSQYNCLLEEVRQ